MSIRRAILAGLTMLCALAGSLTALASSATADECPNAAFRTGTAAHLPDCRAYELVSPENKNEGGVFVEAYSPEGQSLLLAITAGTAGLEGYPSVGIRGGAEAFYTTQRTASGWVTEGADPPISEYGPFQNEVAPVDAS